MKSSLESVFELLKEGKVKPIYSTLPLSDAAYAYDLIESGKVIGKVILTP